MDTAHEMIRYDHMRHINVYISKVRFLNEHMHGSFELSFVLGGGAQFNQGEKTRTVQPGDIILTNPYEPHSYVAQPEEPLILLTMQIHKLFLRRYVDCVPKLIFDSSCIESLPQADYNNVVQLIFQTATAYFESDLSRQFDLLGSATILLGKLVSVLNWKLEENLDSSEKELQNNRVQRLISYIDENYRQKITLSTLADMEGITTTYMSHFFKKAFGVSFQTYLSTQRLEKALILMNDKSLSMVDICMNCGFSDSRYLEAACKRTLGCSVSEYRRRLDQREKDENEVQGDSLNQKYGRKESLKFIQAYLDKNPIIGHIYPNVVADEVV